MGENLLPKKNIIQLSGGLGNQLFQLALGLAVFGHPGRDFLLDSRIVDAKGSKRNLAIGELLDEASFVTVHDLPFNLLRKYKKPFLKNWNFEAEGFGWKTLVERQKLFDSDLVFNFGSYVIGSFIHPAYWGNRQTKIIEEIDSLIRNRISGFSEQSRDPGLLGVHIRRGDYRTDSKTRNFHGLCGLEYYGRSLEVLSNQSDFREVIIFSDEFNVAAKFSSYFDFRSVPVRIDNSENPLELLLQMSKCNTFIGCNSTLSWWAAFLGPSKTRILPSQWFLSPEITINPRELFFPLETIVLPNTLLREDDIF